MSFVTWYDHFAARAHRPRPVIDDPFSDDEGPLRDSLARSLAVFQLGEAGEGRIAHQVRSATLDGIDASFREAIHLFVREEGRHGAILGDAVRALGGQSLRSTWTNDLFVFGRRLLDLRLKLLVLLAAEVIGINLYGHIADHLPPGTLRDALREIQDDEVHHLAFQCDFFRTQTTTPFRAAVFRTAWWSVSGSACAAVIVDHRETMARLGISRVALIRDCLATIREAAERSTGAVPPTTPSPGTTAGQTPTLA